MEKEFYRRNLPHWQPKNAVFDICFRLADTLPKKKWQQLREDRDFRLRELKLTVHNDGERKNAIQIQHDYFYHKYDKMLNSGDYGPTWLSRSDIAEIVKEAFLYRNSRGDFKLICFSIMPNHVHAIFYKIQNPLFKILQSLKRHTSRKANIILNKTGTPFWHPESYDHVIRTKKSLKRKINYQLNNPVKAGFCTRWSDWKFNFLNPEFNDWVNKAD